MNITTLDFLIIAVPIAILFAVLIFGSRKPVSRNDLHDPRRKGPVIERSSARFENRAF
jgi:hypothetical protein